MHISWIALGWFLLSFLLLDSIIKLFSFFHNTNIRGMEADAACGKVRSHKQLERTARPPCGRGCPVWLPTRRARPKKENKKSSRTPTGHSRAVYSVDYQHIRINYGILLIGFSPLMIPFCERSTKSMMSWRSLLSSISVSIALRACTRFWFMRNKW